MKITVVNGTPVRGVTHYMKTLFLDQLEGDKQVVEFYPKDFPEFCLGCKNCFLNGAEKCPHYTSKNAIWNAMLEADLLVFAYPIYALRAPASIKSLLDHLCVHWMVHRPEPIIFEKTAVIITNSVGAPNGPAQKDVKTSLSWMGVSRVYAAGAGMMGDIFVDKMSEKNKDMLAKKMSRLAERVSDLGPFRRKSLKVSLFFFICKMQHKMILKSETVPSLDNQHYINHGWIKR